MKIYLYQGFAGGNNIHSLLVIPIAYRDRARAKIV